MSNVIRTGHGRASRPYLKKVKELEKEVERLNERIAKLEGENAKLSALVYVTAEEREAWKESWSLTD